MDNEKDEHNKEEANKDQHPTPLRRSTRIKRPVTRLSLMMTGQTYDEINHLNVQSSDQVTNYTEEIAPVVTRIILDTKDRALNEASVLQVFDVEKGIKVIHEKGAKATYGEVSQMHERGCFQPTDISELTPKQCKKILNIMTFIIEKRDSIV